MEVHHNTHTERKKFTHYLWEFLMLFLAVFCGFLAENFREHQVEKNRATQYMLSLYEARREVRQPHRRSPRARSARWRGTP